MPQAVRRRTQSMLTQAAGALTPYLLGRGMVYREIVLRLQGQLTATTGNNTAGNTKLGDMWALLPTLQLVANGSQSLRLLSGEQLWWLNWFFYGAQPPDTSALGDGTANPAFDSTLIMPLWYPDTIRPLDCGLDSSLLTELRLDATWGNYTDVNAAATGFTSTPTLTISSVESFGAIFNNAKKQFVYSTPILTRNIQQPTGSNSQFRIQLPVGNMYRGIAIQTLNSGGTEAALLNNVKIYSGTTVFYDLPGSMIQKYNRLKRNNNPAAMTSTASSVNGWYFVDLLSDGYLTEAINTLGFSELILELNVNAAGTVNYIPMQVIVPRG